MRSPLTRLGIPAFAFAAMLTAACGGDSTTTPAPAPGSSAVLGGRPAASVAAPAPASVAPVATTPAGNPTDADIAEATSIYTVRCTPCHGTDGKGDGMAAAALNPKPRNYRDATWQATVTDAEIEKTILLGGAAVGKSPLMPPNPDLASKPMVIAALRMKVRSFAAAAP